MAEELRRSPDADVRALRGAMQDLQRRVTELERAVGRVPATPVFSPRAGAGTAEVTVGSAIDSATVISAASRTVTYLGRLVLVLGGAYLLRSFTEGQTELGPRLVGVALGLTYAFVWIAAAWRALGKNAREAATWHAVAATAIAYPLIWETVVRLHLLPPTVGAALLLIGTVMGLGIAGRHRAQAIGWMFVLGAALSAIGALVPDADATGPYTTVLILLGAAGLWVARARRWIGLAIFTALVADLAALVIRERATAIGQPSAALAIVLLLAVLVAYVGSITGYILTGWRRLDAFDVVQTVLAVGLGLGGALSVAHTFAVAEAPLCASVLVIAMALYLTAFGVLERERRPCFYYVTSVGLTLALIASASLLAQPAWPWAILAIVLVPVSQRLGRMTLGLHAAAYAVAAAVASGLLGFGRVQWLDAAATPTAHLSSVAWVALLALLMGGARRAPDRSVVGRRFTESARVLLLVLAAWVAGAIAIDTLGGMLFSSGGVVDPAWLATTRTGVLAGLTLLAASTAHTPAFRACRFLVPALLGLGALHLLGDDLPHGRPSTLAVSFAIYGLVLLAATRILRAARHPVADPASGTDPLLPDAPSPVTVAASAATSSSAGAHADPVPEA